MAAAAEISDVPTPTGRQTALVAVSQAMVLALGAVIALLVAQFFGKDAETDAFFAAYGFYGVGMTFAQTFRLTTVSSIVSSGPETITRLLGAVGLLCVVLAAPMVVLADPLGRVLVESDPTNIAPLTLRMLWVALSGQLIAAILATVLAVRGRFTEIGVGTLVASVVSVVVFAAMQSFLGVPAAALGLVVSALFLLAVFAIVLWRSGERLARPSHALHGIAHEAGRLGFAGVTFFGTTVGYVICISVSARLGAGQATVFAYGYMLAAVLVGVTANVSAMVRSPALVASADRAREIAGAALWSFRFALVLIGPVLGFAVLLGPPVIGAVLGADFGASDVDQMITTLLALIPWVLGSAAGVFAVVELLARGELRRLALLTAAQMLLLVPLTLGARTIGAGLEGIAGGFSIVMAGGALVQLHWAFPRAWSMTVAAMGRALGREVAVVAAAFVPSAVLLRALGDAAAVTAGASLLAAVLAVGASYVAWPREVGALLAIVGRGPGAATADG
ncbi:hypothetical protein C8N24_2738 [Solirubrobacter pauli]|uniref:O-antigen/teichoic acid export membrane protein n=2 Tax=Solirubrobacter pauli TaxID=166793 RepID=A0A660LD02_9ACTN|nr:hypothetical protein C8N24_2738 [Solirubrobacter pauli]